MHVRCEVEADPPDGVRFSWTYNNTRNVSPVLNSRVSSHGLVSTMTYLPQSDAELVTLACWAINAVGRQTQPCLIHILPASKYMWSVGQRCAVWWTEDVFFFSFLAA